MYNRLRAIAESQLMIDMEQIVLEILQTGMLSFQSLNQLPCVASDCRLHQRRLKHQQLKYSGTINAFINALDAVQYFHDQQVWLSDNTEKFIQAVCQQFDYVGRDLQGFENQEKKNQVRLTGYVIELINHYSQLLFVRVDLFYQRAGRETIGIGEFYQHKEKLLSLISNQDTCFSGLQGYAWALEQGGKTGSYHCHLLLIYDGKKRLNDWYLAQQVGLKWQTITKNKGAFFNANTTEHKHNLSKHGLLGIGMIHRNNTKEVNNAIEAARYLVKPKKADQRLRVSLPGMRSFGTGQFKVSWRRGIK